MLLVSIAKGVQQDIQRQVSDLGVNLLIVLPGRIDEGSMFNASMIGMSYLTEEEVERVKTVPGGKRAVPITFVGGGLKYADRTSRADRTDRSHQREERGMGSDTR